MARSQLRKHVRPRAASAQAPGCQPADQRTADRRTLLEVRTNRGRVTRPLHLKTKEHLRGRRRMLRDVLAARELRDEYALERIPETEAPGSRCRDAYRDLRQVQRTAL